MANEIKNVVLHGLFDGVVADLYPKTSAANVVVDDTTLDQKLATLVSNLEEYITDEDAKSYVDNAVAALKTELMGGQVAEAYNTFKKIADYISDHNDVHTALTSLVNDKVDTEDFEAFKQTLGDLSTIDEVSEDELESTLAAKINGKQEKLTGTSGQVVGFDASGNAIAQDAPATEKATSMQLVNGDSGDEIQLLNGTEVTDRVITALGIDKKQDTVAFEGAYDASSNKAATMADVNAAVSGLSGAMHWKGAVDTVPTTQSGATYAVGDVVTYQGKEYAWDGAAWHELGDESMYSDKVSGWDNAASKAHAHENSDDLAGITSTKISNWDDAYSKSHEHSNKSELDSITSAKIIAWDNKAAIYYESGKPQDLTENDLWIEIVTG